MATAKLKFCPQCGAALLPDSPHGVCPRCAFNVAMLGKGNIDPTIDSDRSDSSGRFIPPKPDHLAQHFPQLEILDLVGQGGMGAVYKARQRGLDRIVALKILPPDAARDPAFAERFGREARALAKLNHPNIVSVYDSGQAGGLFYFIMEFIDGVNLRQALQAGQLKAKEALGIVPQICDALQYAHDEGIVHRDIKPENVLLDTKGRVKIADFGLARLLGKASENFTLTATHQVMGTPRYMAPEQIEGTHDVDHRADIYSLGVVFYEMLTGELPLGRFAPPSKKVQVDVRLDEVVLRTLEKEPDLRYQQASEIKTAVQTIVGGLHPQMYGAYGREYRSQREFFGLPLVHIARGIDPRTGRPRVAKGIIAIGGQAYGGLAIGGFAVGGIAIGGGAVGLVTLGGMSIGLLCAVGGFAAGLGISFGGFALGSVAVGGFAAGIYSLGGSAFGVHPVGGNARDPAAREFFSNWGPILARIGPWIAISSLLVPIGAMLFAIGRGIISATQAVSGTVSSRQNDSSKTPAEVVGCVVLALIAFLIAIPAAILVMLFFVYSARQATVSDAEAEQQAAVEANAAAVRALEASTQAAQLGRVVGPESHENIWLPERHKNLDWTDAGPRLSAATREGLGLTVEAAEVVDAQLKKSFQAYVELESRSIVDSMNTFGTQSVTIKVASEEIEKLQTQFWAGIQSQLNAAQLSSARRRLPLIPYERGPLPPAISPLDLAWPGVFGWGPFETEVAVHKIGDKIRISVQSQGVAQWFPEPSLSPHLKRFLKQAEAAEK